MDTDWSVELGADDETLEFPWSATADLRYFDLKKCPERIDLLSEVVAFPELASTLSTLNAPDSPIRTAKCDAWFDDPIDTSEDIYNASWRLSSYIDVLFDDARRFSFEAHEALVKTAAGAAADGPQITAALELIVRRCYYRKDDLENAAEDTGPAETEADSPWREGFYVTFYLSGYGHDKEQARSSWMAALMRASHAMLQAACQASR